MKTILYTGIWVILAIITINVAMAGMDANGNYEVGLVSNFIDENSTSIDHLNYTSNNLQLKHAVKLGYDNNSDTNAWYTFDNNGDDLSGNSHDLAQYGSAYINNELGFFNSSLQCINNTSSGGYNYVNSSLMDGYVTGGTISWLSYTNSHNPVNTIWSFGTNKISPAMKSLYNSVPLRLSVIYSVQAVHTYLNTAPTTNVWDYYTFTFKNTNQTLYKNGIIEHSLGHATVDPVNDTTGLGICNLIQNISSYQYNGSVDEFAVEYKWVNESTTSYRNKRYRGLLFNQTNLIYESEEYPLNSSWDKYICSYSGNGSTIQVPFYFNISLDNGSSSLTLTGGDCDGEYVYQWVGSNVTSLIFNITINGNETHTPTLDWFTLNFSNNFSSPLETISTVGNGEGYIEPVENVFYNYILDIPLFAKVINFISLSLDVTLEFAYTLFWIFLILFIILIIAGITSPNSAPIAIVLLIGLILFILWIMYYS